MLRLSDLLVKDVMTPSPQALGEDSTLAEAARFLLGRGLSGAPVVGEDGALLSVLSMTDILREVIPALGESNAGAGGLDELAERDIGRLVRRSAITCDEESTVVDACKRMVLERVHRLIVVRDGKPVGIIAAIDAVRVIASLDDITVGK